MESYIFSILLAIRIGLQILTVIWSFDLFRTSKRLHALIGSIAFSIILFQWIIDALTYFMIIERNTLWYDGIIPLFTAVCFSVLALSPKRKILS